MELGTAQRGLSRRRGVLPLLAAASVIAVGAIVAFLVIGHGGGAETAVEDFTAAFESGDYAGAAAMTDGDAAAAPVAARFFTSAGVG